MYKNLFYKLFFIALLIGLFAGCSAPKPETKPAWFTSPPQDYKFFYAVGTGETQVKAKKRAIASLREQLKLKLDEGFEISSHPLGKIQKRDLAKIFKNNTHFTKSLRFKDIKLEKSMQYRGRFLVLISIKKEKLFHQIEKISKPKFEKLKAEYDALDKEIAIKKFAALKGMLKEYPSLATYTEFLKMTSSTYRAEEVFGFLKELKEQQKELRSTISFYVLSDANSQLFTKYIKRAIKKEGLLISRKPLSKNSLKLIVKSKTTEEQEYSFMKSSTLIKFNTYDINKNKIAFKQHTFVGKSRKNYKEAKEQAAIHLQAKINKLGLYQLLGLENKP